MSDTTDTKGKRVQFDTETWQALDLLARDRMMTFQELADEAFRDVLKKHGRPYDTRDAFRRSAKVLGMPKRKDGGENRKRPAAKTKPPAKRRAR